MPYNLDYRLEERHPMRPQEDQYNKKAKSFV
jgi:hypothetical protein